ncbi:MAG: sigma-70 family RNA polymerase sigma factor [Eubacteriales bacterium]
MEKYKSLTDHQLIENLRAGDSEIMDYIMEKYKGLVRKKAKAMYLLGGENDDLIQEGMIGLFKAVQDYDLEIENSFFNFADLCIARQMYSAIQASQRKKHMPLNSYVSIYSEEGNLEQLGIHQSENVLQSDPEELLLGREYQEDIERELEKELSALENRVLYLHLRGEDYKTIAQLLDKTPKAIDNALQRIRAKANKVIVQSK